MSWTSWANVRSPDRRVHVGSLALRVAAFDREGAPPLSPVAGLVVTDVASARTALWHGTTGVYGLLGLAAGPRDLRVEDPAGRWLPRGVAATAPDRAAVVAALEAGDVPPAAAPDATWMDVPLYPTAALPVPPAETVVWGVVTRADVPVPWAFVRVEIDGAAYRGATDAQGVYLLWLRGARVAPGDEDLPPPPRTVTAWGPVAPPAADDPHPTLPADFDALVPGTPAFAAVYAGAGATASQPLPVGRRTRVDLALP